MLRGSSIAGLIAFAIITCCVPTAMADCELTRFDGTAPQTIARGSILASGAFDPALGPEQIDRFNRHFFEPTIFDGASTTLANMGYIFHRMATEADREFDRLGEAEIHREDFRRELRRQWDEHQRTVLSLRREERIPTERIEVLCAESGLALTAGRSSIPLARFGVLSEADASPATRFNFGGTLCGAPCVPMSQRVTDSLDRAARPVALGFPSDGGMVVFIADMRMEARMFEVYRVNPSDSGSTLLYAGERLVLSDGVSR